MKKVASSEKKNQNQHGQPEPTERQTAAANLTLAFTRLEKIDPSMARQAAEDFGGGARIEEIDSIIPKAQAALDAYIVAHAEYEEVWAMAWPVMKSVRYSRHLDRSQPEVQAIDSRFGNARTKLTDAMHDLVALLSGGNRIDALIQRVWLDNQHEIVASEMAGLASRYLESCSTVTFYAGFVEGEVPPIEIREELIVRASIGLALLKYRKQAQGADD